MSMNPEIKAKWVSALRSGEYQQGKMLLRPTENTYCCLGVLCDIATKSLDNTYWGKSSEHGNGALFCPNEWDSDDGLISEDGELPHTVREWAGLDSENPKVTMNEKNIKENYKNIIYNDSRVTLAELNDTHRYNFNEIADIIEEQL